MIGVHTLEEPAIEGVLLWGIARPLLLDGVVRAGARVIAAQFRFHAAGFSTPRRTWSSSIDSKSARKLPSPKPSSPLRWMISKKIGPMSVLGQTCSRKP